MRNLRPLRFSDRQFLNNMASKFTVGTQNNLEKVWNSDIEIEYRKLLATCFKTLNETRELSQKAYKTIKI